MTQESSASIGGTTVTGESMVPVFDCNEYGGYASSDTGFGAFGSGQQVDQAAAAVSSRPVGYDKSQAVVQENQGPSDIAPYKANLRGHAEDGWAMAVCAKCVGRPETMVKACRRATSLKDCQRHEDATGQNVCNMCMDDEVGSVLPKTEKGCSLFRGTCAGSVEKRIRGIVPPNLDIVGATSYGGLRYCAKPSTFSTTQVRWRRTHLRPTSPSNILWPCAVAHACPWTPFAVAHPLTSLDTLPAHLVCTCTSIITLSKTS